MPPAVTSGYVPLVEVVRSGFRESLHHGAAVGIAASGEVAYTRGDVMAAMLPRSAAKPFQAAACLHSGAPISGERIAIAAGSHSGTDDHVALVERTLAAVGLDSTALGCPPDWPLDPKVREELLRHAGERTRARMNCSGKHAAMLAACVAQGWPTTGYLSSDHPLQSRIRAVIEESCGEPVTHTAVDGCGAPQLAVSLTGLATGLRTMLLSPMGSPEHSVITAMRDFPEHVAGEGRDDTRVMRALPGVVAKQGAEGVMVIGTASGAAVAVKIGDGDAQGRGRTIAALAALSHVGVDTTAAATLMTNDVLGGGRPVGTVRALSA